MLLFLKDSKKVIFPVFFLCIAVGFFLYFSLPAQATEALPGNGRHAYPDGADASEALFCFNSSSGCSSAPGFGTLASISGTSNARAMSAKSSPTRNEVLVGNLDANGNLEMLRFDGGSDAWTVEWTEGEVGSTSNDYKAFDVAYEQLSGEAVVAWTKKDATSNELEYRVWDGMSWSASSSYEIARNSNLITFVMMDSHPASGSSQAQNEISLCYITGGKATNGNGVGATKVGCVIWNGLTNSWGNEPSTILESDGEELTATPGTAQSADLFYEQSSGDLVVVWGQEGSNNSAYTVWDGSNWAATASFAFQDPSSVIKCAAMPNISSTEKNKAICANYSGSPSGTNIRDVNAVNWTGSGWGTSASIDTGGPTQSQNIVPVSAMYLYNGTIRGVVAFSSGDTTDVDYATFDNSSTWTVAATTAGGAQTTGTDLNYYSYSNPDKHNMGVVLLHDGSADDYGYYVSMDATGSMSWNKLNSGGAITKDGSANGGDPFGFTFYKNIITTQTHFKWLNDDAAVGSATAISAEDVAASGSEALDVDTVYRLRLQMSNEGAASSTNDKWRLEFARRGGSCTSLSSGWAWNTVPLSASAASHAFEIEASSHFTDGASISAALLTAPDPTFTNGYAMDARATTSNQTLSGNNYTEFEFAVKPTSYAEDGANYCFRAARIHSGSLVASSSYTTLAYAEVDATSPASTFTQNNYGWYSNDNSVQPGGIIGSENTAAAIPLSTTQARLRMTLQVGTADMAISSYQFKLQHAGSTSGPWTDVGEDGSPWSFYNNASPADGADVSVNLLTGSDVRGTYEEGNPTVVNPRSASVGYDVEWDFSLSTASVSAGTTYYFRLVESDGDTLSTYTRYPTITYSFSTGPASDPTNGGVSGGGTAQTGGGQSGSSGGTGGSGSSTDTGLLSPSATGEDYNVWTVPTQAYTSDNLRTTTNVAGAAQDYYNFSFSITTGASIDGIELKLEASQTVCTGNQAIDVELSWDGGASYTSTGNTTGAMTASDVVYTVGGSANTWGRTWSDTEFSNANFRARVTRDCDSSFVNMDHLQAKVYYTTSGDGESGGGSGQSGGGQGDGGSGASPVLYFFFWFLYGKD